MKRILFCASVLALATSCADNELDSFATSGEKQANGITFVADAPLSRMQWDETETSYVPFWYAEQDRIAIYASGAKGGDADASSAAPISGDGWNDLYTITAYTYKATQSEKVGKFTATADDQTLHFDGDKEARFLALYPSSVAGAWSSTTGEVGIKISKLPDLASQIQTTTKGDNQSIMMYSLSKASKVNDYDAVGENAKLSFQRPFSALVLSTDNADEYTKGEDALFGKLTSVEAEAKGYTDPQKVVANNIKASLLTYNDGAYLVVDTLTNKATFFEGTSSSIPAASTAKLTLGGSGLGWSDDALAVVAINNVDRSQTFAKQQKDETIDITWTFGNIVLKQSLKTQNSWNGFIECPKLDISSYDYLVTTDKQLVVLKGNFKDIFVTEEGADKGKIEWPSGNVDKTDITTIISKVALSNEELAMLKDFTSLTSLTLAENTEIPANTFTENQAAAITKLDLPKVTKVDQKFIANDATKAFSALTDLAMASYEFEDATVNKALLNNKLKTLDMSGVRSMLPQFGIERTLSFNGYTALTEVTVQDGMIVSPSGFAGCTSLTTVNGVVDITSAPNAFEMSSTANAKLKSIKVTGTEIPAKAFYNCTALESIECNGASIVPTVIGERAFVDTDALKYMDLSKVTSLGEAAFARSGLTSANKNTTVLEVGATEIPAGAFQDCASIKMVKFTNATKITGTEVFKGATNLIQVKFLKVISLANAAENAYANVFGGKQGQIDLWTNPEQTGINGLVWTLDYLSADGKTTYSQTYTFKSIQKKIED